MNNKLYCLIILISFIALHSCYADLDLEKYREAPKAVLNCAVSPDTIVMASISRTWFFTENNPNVSLQGADVKLYINDIFREQMLWKDITQEGSLNARGIYLSSITPLPGDVVKVTASTEYGEIWAEDIVPPQPEILDVKISYRRFDNGSGTYFPGGYETALQVETRYEITFQDNPDEENYYLVRISVPDSEEYETLYPLDYSGDPVFIGEESIFGGSFEGKFLEGQGGRTFSDETINGKKYTLIVKETYMDEYYFKDKTHERVISLYALSKSYYQYFTSIQYLTDSQIMQNMADYGLTEPRRIFSNVQGGGTGILGASQHVEKIVTLEASFD